MRKFVIAGMVLMGGVVSAQTIEPVLEADGKMVKATYFHENGKVNQQGHFLDGKPEGKWIMFDELGNKKAVAHYATGEKTGKWYFFSGNTVSEVDYSDNRVAAVKNYSKDALVVRE